MHPKKTSIAAVCLLFTSLVAGPVIAQFPGADRGIGAFQKTVGLVPNVCALDSFIEVAAGTTVYYCYDLFDPPNDAYLYNVTDDVLGFIASGFATPLERTTVFASTQVFANVTNVGTFQLELLNTTKGSFEYNDGATVGVNGTIGGGGNQFDPAIPTLSEYALFAFGALLMVGAAVMLRRNSG